MRADTEHETLTQYEAWKRAGRPAATSATRLDLLQLAAALYKLGDLNAADALIEALAVEFDGEESEANGSAR